MLRNYPLLILLVFSLFSCGPEEPIEHCSLDNLDGQSYEGVIYFCNAMPGLQQDIPGLATMSVSESLLTFHVHSKDPNIAFSHTVTVKVDCVEGEPGLYTHKLFSTMDNSDVGEIGLDRTSLSLTIMVDPCSNSTTFTGLLDP